MNTNITVKPNKAGGVIFSIRPDNFYMRDEINFDNPCEDEVVRAIFHEAKSNELRGFTDVFSDEEIVRMGTAKNIWSEWSKENRDWLLNAYWTVVGEVNEV